MYFSKNTYFSNVVLELLYHPQFLCDRIFKCNFNEFIFCHAPSMF
jgi:hypothetical protein